MRQRPRIRRQGGALGQIIPYPVSKALTAALRRSRRPKENERGWAHAMAAKLGSPTPRANCRGECFCHGTRRKRRPFARDDRMPWLRWESTRLPLSAPQVRRRSCRSLEATRSTERRVATGPACTPIPHRVPLDATLLQRTHRTGVVLVGRPSVLASCQLSACRDSGHNCRRRWHSSFNRRSPADDAYARTGDGSRRVGPSSRLSEIRSSWDRTR
jgi:hypothetical protein